MIDLRFWPDDLIESIGEFPLDIQEAAQAAYIGLAESGEFADTHVSNTTVAFAQAIAAERERCAQQIEARAERIKAEYAKTVERFTGSASSAESDPDLEAEVQSLEQAAAELRDGPR